jgi:hypothetical protein
MNVLNWVFKTLDMHRPGRLPSFDAATQILTGSDYGGQHPSSQYESLAFAIADAMKLRPWDEARVRCRKAHLPDGRRMSFKSLNDKLRVAALPDFLSAADLVPGLLLVVLFDKQIGSIFDADEEQPKVPDEFRKLFKWPARTQERMLRICHVMALVLAGLSREMQNVLWITDEDEIAANVERHTLFTKAFGNIASHYLEHRLGHLRVATTASDTGKRDLEDFVAIADLAAGAICHCLNAYGATGLSSVAGLVVPPPPGAPPKVDKLLDWFSNDATPLRRLVLSIDVVPSPRKLMVRHLDLVGSNSLFRLRL